MKNRLQETINRYTAKCKQMKAEQLGGKLYEYCHRYGGSYYLYHTLQERGFLTGESDNLKFTGAIPTEKEMRSIVRHVNTLSRNAKPRKDKPKKYTKRSTYWKQPVKIQSSFLGAETITTTSLIVSALERELTAHHSNGETKIHLENVCRLAADLGKII